VITQAKDLGISFVLLAKGEPLMRPEILDITNDLPEVIFPLFTNGLLITDNIIARLQNQKNIIPVISMEGYESDTDNRRGRFQMLWERPVIDMILVVFLGAVYFNYRKYD